MSVLPNVLFALFVLALVIYGFMPPHLSVSAPFKDRFFVIAGIALLLIGFWLIMRSLATPGWLNPAVSGTILASVVLAVAFIVRVTFQVRGGRFPMEEIVAGPSEQYNNELYQRDYSEPRR